MPFTLGQRIQRARFSKGWSLRKLNEESGVSVGAIRRIESGENKAPLGQILWPLAEALDLDPDELLDAIAAEVA